ncbi:Segregation and condensation protein A [Streptococcus sp. DD10]|nr:Segregation and condensation protein A [Streptococcus sp. DD10]
MDIYDVPITDVIEQYLAYVSTVQAMRLEIAGEYMVMASQLMLIKSRKLLPKVATHLEVEDSPEMELLTQIEEYRKFKLLSEKLDTQHQERAQHFSKPKMELIYDDAELVQDKSTIDIFLAFSQILLKKKEEFRKNHTTIVKEEYKIEDMMEVVRSRCQVGSQTALSAIFKETKDLEEVVTLFLATLELVKIQELVLLQEEAFGEIYLLGRVHE